MSQLHRNFASCFPLLALLLALAAPVQGALLWRGGLGGNAWDINTTSNWFNGSTASVYLDGSAVTFDNSGGTNPTVTIPATVSPASVTVNTSSNYTFTGAGGLGGGASLTNAGAGTVTLATASSYSGATVILAGTLQYAGAGGNSGNGAYTVSGGAALTLGGGTVAASTLQITKSTPATTVNLNAGILSLSGNITASGSGAVSLINFNGGTLKAAGPFGIPSGIGISILAGGGTLDTAGGDITTASGLGYGAATSGEFILKGGRTFIGRIANGSAWTGNLTLSDPGTIWQLNAAFPLPGTLTLNAGTMLDLNSNSLSVGGLTGAGTVVNTGATATLTLTGTLAPGGNGIGRLTINNALTLAAASQTQMEINRAAGTNDVVTGLTTVNFGGTLTVTNLAGTNVPGDSYRLFASAHYTNDFAARNLPALAAGLDWAWNATNGTLTVVSNGSVPEPPQGVIRATLNGTNLTLAWPPSYLGWFLASNSTDIADPGCWYDVPGSQSVTNLFLTVDSSQTNVFYRLRKPMNIVLLLADDWRYDTLHCAGDPVVQTPSLDKLATEGLRFTHAGVSTAICWVSRACIFTGQWMSRHGVTGATSIPNWAETYPGLLRANGYWVGHVGKWHNGSFPAANFDFGRAYHGQHWYTINGVLTHVTQRNDNDAMDFLRTRPTNQPFMLTVASFAPHAEDANPLQYLPQPETTNLYTGVTVPVPVNATDESFYRLPPFLATESNEGRVRWHWRFDTPEKYQIYMKNYYRLCTGVDTMFGHVLDELKAQGVLDNTLVIFAGDNGYYHAEHGLADKWYPHQESIRVPLIIRDPRMALARRGQTNDEFALNVDFAPTFLTAAGIPVPARMQGADLAPLYRTAPAPAWRTEFFYEHPIVTSTNRIPSSQALVRKDWKYFYWPDFATEQLFDLGTDPIEEADRIADPTQSARLAEMRQRFTELKTAAQ